MTTPSQQHHPFRSTPCLALLCAGLLCADSAWPKKERAPKPASAPTTAQILEPSAAASPDALAPDKRVYRCGNSYSARPCAGAAPLDVADPRTDAQRRQSAELTARDQRLAAWYEAGRHDREKAPSAPAGGRPASAAAACTSTIMMSCVPKKPRKRTAVVKGKN